MATATAQVPRDRRRATGVGADGGTAGMFSDEAERRVVCVTGIGSGDVDPILDRGAVLSSCCTGEGCICQSACGG